MTINVRKQRYTGLLRVTVTIAPTTLETIRDGVRVRNGRPKLFEWEKRDWTLENFFTVGATILADNELRRAASEFREKAHAWFRRGAVK